MGSLNEFGWLAKENVTSHQKVTKICSEIPAVLRTLVSPRSSLGETSTPLRMTYRFFIYLYVLEVALVVSKLLW